MGVESQYCVKILQSAASKDFNFVYTLSNIDKIIWTIYVTAHKILT